MTAEWFNPDQYAWVPGTAYAIVAAAMGGLVAYFAPKGRARQFIVRAWLALWAAAVVLLVAGLVAELRGQPWAIWYGLELPGVVGTLVVGGNTLVILKTYRQVEQRRLAAKDLL
jgi:L-lactate permease